MSHNCICCDNNAVPGEMYCVECFDNNEDANITQHYIAACVTTRSNEPKGLKAYRGNISVHLLHAALGISTEAAEILDVVKKSLFYGKEPDLEHLREEIGDLLWYVSIALDDIGTDYEDVMARNIAKLRARYADKFTSTEAINRDTIAEEAAERA